MVNYQHGKIYRLECGDLIYIGSTTYQLSARKAKHKCDYIAGRTYRSVLLYQYAVENGLSLTEDIRIELIENYPCNSKEELNAIEGKYIRQYKEEYVEKCVNKCIPGRTRKERYEQNKDKLLQQRKEYYEDNKDKIAEHKKQFRKDNSEKLAEQGKVYYERNKEKLLQQRKENYLFKKIDKMFDLR
jgi:hypothetical protein